MAEYEIHEEADGFDVPSPVDWEQASHWVEYDNVNFTVETWCKFGPDYKFRLCCRRRPMVGSEIIHAKLVGHSREEILKAYGVVETPDAKPNKVSLWIRLASYVKKVIKHE